MKKEVVLAIIFGLLVGLTITFGIYWSKNKNSNDTQEDTSTANKIALEFSTAEQDDQEINSLVKITQPLHESVQTEKTVSLSGVAFPGSYVVVFINDQEKIAQADADGKVELKIDLESGSNILSMHSIDDNGQTHSDQITVIYTNKSLEENLVSDSEIKIEAEKQK